nr:cytidine deaminase [uncultured bacterium]
MRTKEDFRPLADAAIDASRQSYSPYSQFKVGAAILTADRKVYQGTNVENASYGGTICAERTALVKLVSEERHTMEARAPRTYIEAIAVASNLRGEAVCPCGMCLQFMQEFMSGHEPIILVNRDTRVIEQVLTLQELLPHAFRLLD